MHNDGPTGEHTKVVISSIGYDEMSPTHPLPCFQALYNHLAKMQDIS